MILKKILALDAITCALMGVVLVSFASILCELMGVSKDLLFYAGCLLFPTAAFMAFLSCQDDPSASGVRLVVIGNIAWVAASFLVLAIADPNLVGAGLIILQALVVVLFAWAEFRAAPRLQPRAG